MNGLHRCGLPRIASHGVTALLAAITLATVSGCKQKQPIVTSQPVAPTLAYADLAAVHNSRVAQLQTLYGYGVLEVIWFDADGHRHKDQGSLELWLNLPRKTSLRVDAVGEVLLWAGSDERQFWVFDHLGKEKVLRTGSHAPGVDLHNGAFSVRPLAMIDLMGLTPLPAEQAQEPAVTFDSKLDAWVVEAPGGGGTMRMYFDRKSMLPRHIESLDDTGKVRIQSDLDKYESVKRKGMSPAAFPRMAEVIDIIESVPNGEKSGKVKVAVNEYTDGLIDEQPFDRVFDLSRLMPGFEPDRIEGSAPSSN